MEGGDEKNGSVFEGEIAFEQFDVGKLGKKMGIIFQESRFTFSESMGVRHVMAEGARFELAVGLHPHWFSRPTH